MLVLCPDLGPVRYIFETTFDSCAILTYCPKAEREISAVQRRSSRVDSKTFESVSIAKNAIVLYCDSTKHFIFMTIWITLFNNIINIFNVEILNWTFFICLLYKIIFLSIRTLRNDCVKSTPGVNSTDSLQFE